MAMSDETRPMAATPPSEPPPPQPPASPSDAHRRRLILIGAGTLAGIALLVVAFFVGQSTGSTTQNGPTNLGAALAAARTGSLPCGTSTEVTRRALDRLCSATAGTGGGAASGAGGGTGAAGGAGRALMVGTIQSISGNQVTVQTGQGPITLTVGSGAAVRTLSEGSATDLTNGARVLITGGQQANGVRQIVVLGAGAGASAANGGAGTTTPPTS
jgi:hypothetical protein